MKTSPTRTRRKHGFLLIEIMIAIAIFALGVIALGRCVANCMTAQEVRNSEERARLALENGMAEIQASPVLPNEIQRTPLKGMFEGMTLIEQRHTIVVENEDHVTLPDLHRITLTVEWKAGGAAHSRELNFTLLRGRG